MRLKGEEHEDTLREANNYATSLIRLERFEEAKALFRKTILIARRVLGDSSKLTLQMMAHYGTVLHEGTTLDDLREAVTTLEDAARTARRVLGGAHPTTVGIETELRDARNARETGLAGALANMRV